MYRFISIGNVLHFMNKLLTEEATKIVFFLFIKNSITNVMMFIWRKMPKLYHYTRHIGAFLSLRIYIQIS